MAEQHTERTAFDDWFESLHAAQQQGWEVMRQGMSAWPGHSPVDQSMFLKAWQEAANQADAEASVGQLVDGFRESLRAMLELSEDARAPLAGPLEAAVGMMRQLVHGQGQGSPTAIGHWLLAPFQVPMPKLGMFQHQQALLERSAEALEQYQSAFDQYYALVCEAVESALAAFETRLEELQEQDAFPESLRELHREWVASGEAAYEASIQRDAYALALGQLTNAGMRVLRETQTQFDELAGQLNLPTRRELDDTQRRLHELQREQRHQRALVGDVASLRDEVASLRAELSRLKSGDEPPPG